MLDLLDLLEEQKKYFDNHVATFTDYGNIKILDFRNPNSINYQIRFLFEEDYYRLHISGDLGELIATNYSNMTFDKFTDFVNDIGYFEGKIDCHSRSIYCYDYDKAREKLKKIIKENEFINRINLDFYESYEEKIEDLLDEILADFSDEKGIDYSGYERLLELDADAWEYAFELGKMRTGILELYMLAFKLAMDQLNKEVQDER